MASTTKPVITPVHAILVVIIRFWVAGFIFSTLNSIVQFFPIFSNLRESWQSGYSGYFLSWALTLTIGVSAWVYAPKMARMVFPGKDHPLVNVNVGADDLVMIGSFLIGGFYLLSNGLTLIIDGVFLLVEMNKDDPIFGSVRDNWRHFKLDIVRITSTLLTVIIAFFLTFRPRMLANMFSSLRSAGLSKIEAARFEQEES